jgi:hypothetical protein
VLATLLVEMLAAYFLCAKVPLLYLCVCIHTYIYIDRSIDMLAYFLCAKVPLLCLYTYIHTYI